LAGFTKKIINISSFLLRFGTKVSGGAIVIIAGSLAQSKPTPLRHAVTNNKQP